MSFHYSTDEMLPRHRTQYWRDSVATHLIPAEAKYTDPRNFQGLLSGGGFGNLTVCEMRANPHTFVRTREMLRQESDEDFTATFLLEGTMRFEQGGRSVRAKPGSIVLVDAARPFKHEMETIRSIVVRLPRRRLLASFPRAEELTGIEIARSDSITPLLRQLVTEALRLQGTGETGAGESRFSFAVLDMLIAAMERISADDPGQRSRYRQIQNRAIQHIDEHIGDSAMDIRGIASAVCTSPRTLARAFAMHGTTVMQYTWGRRLELASRLLSEGRVDNVTEAAYEAGFNDLSHFTRSFKSAFGVTPGSLLRGRDERARA